MRTTRLMRSGGALLAVLFSLGSLYAQDDPPKTVQVRFRLFGWDNASAGLNYSQAGKDAAVEIYEGVRSPFYPYAGPAAITFYRLKAGADGKMEKVPAAEANLEGAGPWPLLLFFEVPGVAGKYKVQVIPDDLKSFPAGSFKIANYTNGTISGSLGDQTFELPPARMTTLAGRTAANATTLFASVYKHTPQGKEPVYSNNWAFQPTMRTLVFVRQSPDSSTGVVARRITESAIFPKEQGKHLPGQDDGQ